MDRKEQIQFVLTFNYDTEKKEDFESIWNLGFKILKMVDDDAEVCKDPVEVVVNESDGAIIDRRRASA